MNSLQLDEWHERWVRELEQRREDFWELVEDDNTKIQVETYSIPRTPTTGTSSGSARGPGLRSSTTPRGPRNNAQDLLRREAV